VGDSEYLTIALPGLTTVNIIYSAKLKAWGSLCALQVLRFGAIPTVISPFLLHAVISGINSLLDLDFLEKFAPKQASWFRRWIELGPDAILDPTEHADLISILTDAMNTDVSRCVGILPSLLMCQNSHTDFCPTGEPSPREACQSILPWASL
jgi:hypothetical protein